MFNGPILVQVINPSTHTVTQHLSRKDSTWEVNYQQDRANNPTFPLNVNNADFNIVPQGQETKVHCANESVIYFSERYGSLPEGFLIAITFPQGFLPKVFKFAENTMIPTGHTSTQSPGYAKLWTDNTTRNSVITFEISSRSAFSFKCTAKKTDDFPSEPQHPFMVDFVPGLGFMETHPIEISQQDLLVYEDSLSENTDIAELTKLINTLINKSEREQLNDNEQDDILTRIKESLATGASIVTLTQSGTPELFNLLTYALLDK